ncbi:ABC transporter permease [Siphonobacter sp. BAB-5385]|uniref:ABC transporter permease n=1 Tax=Siphonobacter curvatus TaxID=2094562 RepID=A0A2S7IMV9_9BACT|nr:MULTISPECIES: heme exporter protein CcmB [Siphonobacter]OZI08027.1 ABC transporter permease [Siphonobacter sp. BAB-5385]PMD97005.1 ABC transporter permease [Siphonobacter sp. BAB-5405]PQA59025.1 ABC transporter permease [Siphonobacter curvatus]
MREVNALIAKEIRLEWRQRNALNGMLLYLVSTIFVCYLSFRLKSNRLEPLTWNTLFWIIQLFTAVSAIAKSFTQERAGRLLYYYTLASPVGIILSKMIYNTVLMLGLSVLGFGIYAFVMGNPVGDVGMYLVAIVLGALGFAGTLTMVAGIASKAENSPTLMSVLSFPIILPMLLMLLKLSKNALDGLDWGSSSDEILTLLALNGIVWVLSLILFPFIWKS